MIEGILEILRHISARDRVQRQEDVTEPSFFLAVGSVTIYKILFPFTLLSVCSSICHFVPSSARLIGRARALMPNLQKLLLSKACQYDSKCTVRPWENVLKTTTFWTLKESETQRLRDSERLQFKTLVDGKRRTFTFSPFLQLQWNIDKEKKRLKPGNDHQLWRVTIMWSSYTD